MDYVGTCLSLPKELTNSPTDSITRIWATLRLLLQPAAGLGTVPVVSPSLTGAASRWLPRGWPWLQWPVTHVFCKQL